jgi:CheY-like chemotaxis protein
MQTVVIASDAPSVRAEVIAVIGGSNFQMIEVRSGPEVVEVVRINAPDLVILDLQMGNMGGFAVCLELRLEESYANLPHVQVMLLLDRRADVHLAKRSGAEGWLVKPLDPIRLRRASRSLLDGNTYHDDSFQPVPLMVQAS